MQFTSPMAIIRATLRCSATTETDMLVLTRKTGQAIVIDARIRVRVLCVRGNRVRLGVEAPTDVPIRRNEVGTSRARHAEPSGQSAANGSLLELCPRI